MKRQAYKKRPDTRLFYPVQIRDDMSYEELRAAGGCICLKGNADTHLHTIHAGQIVRLETGDWVMPEADGEHFYPIKPDVFDANYEPVEEPSL